MTMRTLKQVTFVDPSPRLRFNMLARVLTAVCLVTLSLELTLCQHVTPTPVVTVEPAAANTLTHADDNGQPLKLTCPNDNEDHFLSTGWYMCLSDNPIGLYRFSANNTDVRVYNTDPKIADEHNITGDGALLAAPGNCSQERTYICNKWANVGYRNQCWVYSVKNCTLLTVTSSHWCSCPSSRARVMSGSPRKSIDWGIGLIIGVLTITRV